MIRIEDEGTTLLLYGIKSYSVSQKPRSEWEKEWGDEWEGSPDATATLFYVETHRGVWASFALYKEREVKAMTKALGAECSNALKGSYNFDVDRILNGVLMSENDVNKGVKQMSYTRNFGDICKTFTASVRPYFLWKVGIYKKEGDIVADIKKNSPDPYCQMWEVELSYYPRKEDFGFVVTPPEGYKGNKVRLEGTIAGPGVAALKRLAGIS